MKNLMAILWTLLSCLLFLQSVHGNVRMNQRALSPATVRIHQKRSADSKVQASVDAQGVTHHLTLEERNYPPASVEELLDVDNGSLSLRKIDTSNRELKFLEDPNYGSILYYNKEGALEGMLSDSLSLVYQDKEHYVTEIEEENTKRFDNYIENEILKGIKLKDFPSDERNHPYGTDGYDLPFDETYDYMEELRAFGENISRAAEFDERCSDPNEYISFDVELLMFVDSILAHSIGEPYYVNLYVNAHIKAVNKMFKTLPGIGVNIRLIHTIISASPSVDRLLVSSPNYLSSHLDSTQYTFSHTVAAYSHCLPNFDVAYLLTGRDLYRNHYGVRYSGYKGRVFAIGTPCFVSRYYAFSTGVSEDYFYSGVIHTARYLAQILGAGWEGYGYGSSDSYLYASWGYIMSNACYISRRTYMFSAYSAECIKRTYFQRWSYCLGYNANPRYSVPDWSPGFTTSIAEQCRKITGVSWAVPLASFGDYQCTSLKCKFGWPNGRWYFYSRIPTLDGSNCGPAHWCDNGLCQQATDQYTWSQK